MHTFQIVALAAAVLAGSASQGQAQTAERYSYDVLGRLVAVERPTDITTTYGFDAAGNRTGASTYNQVDAVWQAEDLPHIIGYPIADGWGADTSLGYGFMTYGPYTSGTPTGLNIATWRIRIDDNVYIDTSDVVSLDVWDATAGVQLGAVGFERHAWTAANSYQNFELPFALVAGSSGHQLEFRTWYTARAAVVVDKIGYRHAGGAWSALDPSIYHNAGHATSDGWAADAGQPGGYMTYGPYTASVPTGPRTAVWRMRLDDNASDTAQVVTIDIWDATAGQQLGGVTLHRQAWKGTNQFELFDIPFAFGADRAGHQLEFRTFAHGNANVVVNWVGYR